MLKLNIINNQIGYFKLIKKNQYFNLIYSSFYLIIYVLLFNYINITDFNP